ncbi:MAG: S-4TM family putative pore-forming effector [Planctomycetia bacterium]|nr:S-4TM family putative pore-forming effector [Planctomycetia bacterium]
MQNEEIILKCLLAQHQLYNKAKKWSCLQLAIIVILPVITSILSLYSDIAFIATIFGIVTLVSFLMEPVVNKHITHTKTRAASIQEYIDVTLFSQVLGCDTIEWGDILSNSDALREANSANGDTSDIKNWYSDYSNQNKFSQVFHCQKQNICWDKDLKQNCVYSVCILIFFLFLIFVIFSAYNNLDFCRMISILVWFVPLINHLIHLHLDLSGNIHALEKLKELHDSIENDSQNCDNEIAFFKLRNFQQAIQQNREKGVLIPGWIYQYHKTFFQKREDKTARDVCSQTKPKRKESKR